MNFYIWMLETNLFSHDVNELICIQMFKMDVSSTSLKIPTFALWTTSENESCLKAFSLICNSKKKVVVVGCPLHAVFLEIAMYLGVIYNFCFENHNIALTLRTVLSLGTNVNSKADCIFIPCNYSLKLPIYVFARQWMYGNKFRQTDI